MLRKQDFVVNFECVVIEHKATLRAEEPLGTFLTKRVPEVVVIRPADWPENFFLANKRVGLAG